MEEDTLDLRRYVEIVLARWWIFVAIPLVTALIGFLYSSFQTPTYQATTSVLVQEGSALPSFSDINLAQQVAATYEQLLVSRPFLEDVASQIEQPISVGELKQSIRPSLLAGTQILRISVWHEDPVLAADVANASAEIFISNVRDTRLTEIALLASAAAAQGIDPGDLFTAQMIALGSLSIFEPALVPASPVLPRTRQNVISAAALGGLLAIVVAFLLEHFGDNVKNIDRLQRRFTIPVVGEVPEWNSRDVPPGDIVMLDESSSRYAESIRQIRTSLQFVMAAQPFRTLLVTSSDSSEGKSTIAANLAVAFAKSGVRTVLIDGDLRRPSVHTLFKLNGATGLTTYLAQPDTNLGDILQESGVYGLQIIPCGPQPPNPSELLSVGIQAVLNELSSDADVVILDSPPVLPVADSVVLASHCDTVLLVADAQKTRMETVRRSLATLQPLNMPIVALVNNVSTNQRYGYGNDYHYYAASAQRNGHRGSAGSWYQPGQILARALRSLRGDDR